MKTFIALLLLLPNLSWGNEKVIYCYEYEATFNINENEALIKKILDNKSFQNASNIQYFIIDDKKKKITHFKTYSEYKSEYTDVSFYKFYYKEEPKDDFKINIFNKNEIYVTDTYENFEGRKRESDYDFDRVTGIMLYTYGIIVDENGNRYTENWETKEKFYKKDDSTGFLSNAGFKKYICEPHKGL